jgi:hypothetical protein
VSRDQSAKATNPEPVNRTYVGQCNNDRLSTIACVRPGRSYTQVFSALSLVSFYACYDFSCRFITHVCFPQFTYTIAHQRSVLEINSPCGFDPLRTTTDNCILAVYPLRIGYYNFTTLQSTFGGLFSADQVFGAAAGDSLYFYPQPVNRSRVIVIP